MRSRMSAVWMRALALLLLAAPAAGAERGPLTASLERNPVHAGESVRLVLELERASGGLKPDLTPLESDFEVLQVSANTQIEFVQRWSLRAKKSRLPSELHAGQRPGPDQPSAPGLVGHRVPPPGVTGTSRNAGAHALKVWNKRWIVPLSAPFVCMPAAIDSTLGASAGPKQP